MTQIWTNNAISRLASSITNVATSLSLVSGGGADFPATAGGSFIATLIKADGSAFEIISVTARTGDAFGTIVRAQEGTTAVAFAAGDSVELRISAGWLNAVSVFLVNAALAAIAALTPAADKIAYFTSGSAAALTTLTSFMRTLLDDTDAVTARATLGLVIGTNVQAQDPELAALAGLTSAADKVPYFTGSGTAAVTDLTSAARTVLDDTTTAAMLTTLGAVPLATLTTKGDLYAATASATAARVGVGSDGQALVSRSGATPGVAWENVDDPINVIIDGAGATITTGIKGDVQMKYAGSIISATLLADQSGSIVVNIWKDTYANFPPDVADKITASAPPTISTATKSTDSTLTGWTTTFAAGDVLRFNVDSVTTIQRVTLCLHVRRT